MASGRHELARRVHKVSRLWTVAGHDRGVTPFEEMRPAAYVRRCREPHLHAPSLMQKVERDEPDLDRLAQASTVTGSLLFHLALVEAVTGDALAGASMGSRWAGWRT